MALDIMIFSDIRGDLDNSNIDSTNCVTSAVTAVDTVVASFNQISHERDSVALIFKFMKVALHENLPQVHTSVSLSNEGNNIP